jgi:type VI secretion system protein ImpF
MLVPLYCECATFHCFMGSIMAAVVASGLIEENPMQGFTTGLFDRLDDDSEQAPGNKRAVRARALDDAMRSVTRDLQALLNTRSALSPTSLAPYPAVSGSIVNYGLIDFAGMSMNSDTDQQEICRAVRLAIERHEPRLHQVEVTLRGRKGAINRVDFVITARLKSTLLTEPMSFNAVFRPSLQQYSIEGTN